jgi:hypothetical protein
MQKNSTLFFPIADGVRGQPVRHAKNHTVRLQAPIYPCTERGAAAPFDDERSAASYHSVASPHFSYDREEVSGGWIAGKFDEHLLEGDYADSALVPLPHIVNLLASL